MLAWAPWKSQGCHPGSDSCQCQIYIRRLQELNIRTSAKTQSRITYAYRSNSWTSLGDRASPSALHTVACWHLTTCIGRTQGRLPRGWIGHTGTQFAGSKSVSIKPSYGCRHRAASNTCERPISPPLCSTLSTDIGPGSPSFCASLSHIIPWSPVTQWPLSAHTTTQASPLVLCHTGIIASATQLGSEADGSCCSCALRLELWVSSGSLSVQPIPRFCSLSVALKKKIRCGDALSMCWSGA